MLQRCLNPNNPAYHNYGGRGITVCPQWLDFEQFYRDVGDPPPGGSIDRQDNNRGYEPSNVRWADTFQQAANTRRATIVNIDSRSQVIAEWLREYGIPYVTYKTRRRNGWDMKKALTTPPRELTFPSKRKQARANKIPEKGGPKVLITLNGKTQRLCDWLRELNFPRELYKTRRRKGWSAERALTAPR